MLDLPEEFCQRQNITHSTSNIPQPEYEKAYASCGHCRGLGTVLIARPRDEQQNSGQQAITQPSSSASSQINQPKSEYETPTKQFPSATLQPQYTTAHQLAQNTQLQGHSSATFSNALRAANPTFGADSYICGGSTAPPYPMPTGPGGRPRTPIPFWARGPTFSGMQDLQTGNVNRPITAPGAPLATALGNHQRLMPTYNGHPIFRNAAPQGNGSLQGRLDNEQYMGAQGFYGGGMNRYMGPFNTAQGAQNFQQQGVKRPRTEYNNAVAQENGTSFGGS
jgi:hypothetical protein